MDEFKHTCPKCGESFLNRDMVDIITLRVENNKLRSIITVHNIYKNIFEALNLHTDFGIVKDDIVNKYKNLFNLWNKSIDEALNEKD